MSNDSVPYLAIVNPPAEAELARAEEELRARARNLGKQIEITYWELGKAIYEVWDGVPGGWRSGQKGANASGKGLYVKWGYDTFEEYCEKEVGMRRRTASNLRYAYWWFEHHLTLPAEVKDRLQKLGRTKLYALAGTVTEDNIISWIERAESMTAEEVKKATITAKAVAARKSSDDNPDEGAVDPLYEYADKASRTQAAGDGSDPREAPAPDVMHTLHTSLYEGQWQTWNDAFQRAKEITSSDKVSHNLEMICLDYLSNNDFLKPEDSVKLYLSKIEKLLGLKLIAIDPQSGKPEFGADLLWLMVQARVDGTLDPQSNGTSVPNDKLVNELKLVVDDEVADDESEPTPSF